MSNLWQRVGRVSMIAVGLIGSVAILAVLIGPVALWATPVETALDGKDKADAINATRQVLLTAAGGLALLVGAAFTIRTFYLSRRGQVTDRYTAAITLLGSDKTTERIGGVYALEHLMIESARDHETIVAVLSGFVREQSTSSSTNVHEHELDDVPEAGLTELRPATDVQAALSVLGRRPRRPELHYVDLSLADLCGASLDKASLDGAELWRAKLRSASMFDINLRRANLCGAKLQKAQLNNAALHGARLSGAELQEAWLVGAQLQGADLRDAQLQGAVFGGANFDGARLDGAQLQGANLVTDFWGDSFELHGLTVDQLATAVIDDTTQLPNELRIGRLALNHEDRD